MRVDEGEAASPPPRDQTTGKAKRNQGWQDLTVRTINGRPWHRRWHSAGEGATAPLDRWLDTIEATIYRGVREMARRLNGDGKNFERRRPTWRAAGQAQRRDASGAGPGRGRLQQRLRPLLRGWDPPPSSSLRPSPRRTIRCPNAANH
jgi:hypothetical protein